ncbi:unnamed protein product [Urochloa humidicola]
MGSEPPDPVLSSALLLGGSRFDAGVGGEDDAGGCGRALHLDKELMVEDAGVVCSTGAGTYWGMLFDSCSKSEIDSADVAAILQSGEIRVNYEGRYVGVRPVVLEGCGSIDLNLEPESICYGQENEQGNANFRSASAHLNNDFDSRYFSKVLPA